MRTVFIFTLLLSALALGVVWQRPVVEIGSIRTVGIDPVLRDQFRPDPYLVSTLFGCEAMLKADRLTAGGGPGSWPAPPNAHRILQGSVERWMDRVLITWYWEEAGTGRITQVHSALYDYDKEAISALVKRSLEDFREATTRSTQHIPPVASRRPSNKKPEVVMERKLR
jgi:hypothetical protein